MTIAACYVTPEGVVLGADSTASAMFTSGFHYFNYNQKVFEIGEPGLGTLGVVTWGLADYGTQSHRTIFALLNDFIADNRPKTIKEIADKLIDLAWTAFDPLLLRLRQLNTKKAFDQSATAPDPAARTRDEEEEFEKLKRGLVLGFCIGGYLPPRRIPEAFSIVFDPLSGKPTATLLPVGSWNFWGAPNMIRRLMFGCDEALRQDLLESGKWSGSAAELDALLSQYRLATPTMPIREAIDFVHACCASTIKAMKFSNLAQICGGPIEIAVITTDRRFRWVRHKEWDVAISEGAP